MNLRLLNVLAFSSLLLFACGEAATEHNEETEAVEEVATEEITGIFADIRTNRGTITLQLEMKKTPLTVCNFVGLAEGKIALLVIILSVRILYSNMESLNPVEADPPKQ